MRLRKDDIILSAIVAGTGLVAVGMVLFSGLWLMRWPITIIIIVYLIYRH